AGPLLRYRRSIGADHVLVLCDLKKKHASHAITADIGIAEAAEAAEVFGADGLIVTGSATRKPARIDGRRRVQAARRLPVLVGSGVVPATVEPFLEHADGLIVGSYIKQGGKWFNPVDPGRCREIVSAR